MINTNLKLASGLHEARLAEIDRHLSAPSRLAAKKNRKIRRSH